jgi:hypothetical protein
MQESGMHKSGLVFFFFFQYWGLNSGLYACKEGTLLLKPCLKPQAQIQVLLHKEAESFKNTFLVIIGK